MGRPAVLTRGGPGPLLVLACGLLWMLWGAAGRHAGRIGPISGWLLLLLGVAVLATASRRFPPPPPRAC